MEVVEDEAHPTEDDDIRICLEADPGEELVVGLAGNREDRDLLAFDERVEDVDHRHVGADHLVGHDPQRRVDRWRADVDLAVGLERWLPVDRASGAVEYPTENVFRKRGLLGVSEEADLGVCGKALSSGENLEAGNVAFDLDDPRGRGGAIIAFHDGQFAECDVGRPDLDHVSDDFQQPGVADQLLYFFGHRKRGGCVDNGKWSENIVCVRWVKNGRCPPIVKN